MPLIRDIKENSFKVFQQKFNPDIKFNFADQTSYELPDKKNIVIGKEAYEICEIFFGYDNYRSIVDMLNDLISKIDVNIKKDVICNIVLTGGTINTRMFFERF